MSESPFQKGRRGFTLVEILAAISVLFLLLTLLLTVTNSVSTTVRRTSASIDAFAASRSAFDLMNQKLSQATLNTYWDYDNVLNPKIYLRQSDLQFVIRPNADPKGQTGYGQEIYFQAPESYALESGINSTSGLLNACSFYVQYSGSDTFRPSELDDEAPRYRYRLMHGIIPTESKVKKDGDEEDVTPFHEDIAKYIKTKAGTNERYADSSWVPTWFTDISVDTTTNTPQPIADNVIALVLWPRLASTDVKNGNGDELTKDYTYDSKKDSFPTVTPVPAGWEQPLTANQLPPTIQVTLISISEASASRLDTKSAGNRPQIIEEALANKFKSVGSFQKDLDDISKKLTENNIEFHIANTSVPLRESKWSDATPQ